ncbi:MAG TPA: hypothetical protein VMT50_04875 [Steroidobacteraceae bacterium]|nr:hypothetical protein [Steroidobacteraceae bacterium]
MARVPESKVGATPYERVLGHAPHVLGPWVALEEAFFKHSLLPAELLEQVRRTLALGHGCPYCIAKGGPPDDRPMALRVSLAVAVAQAYASGHRNVDARTVATLREHFTDAELVELVAFVAFMWAGGTFGQVMDIQPASQNA